MATPAPWYSYSQWVKNVARNTRIVPPTGAELAAIKTFIKVICDTDSLGTSTRPWLASRLHAKAVRPNGGYEGDVDNECTPAIVKMLEIVGRDFKKHPVTTAEKNAADILFIACSARVFGKGPTWGGVIGSISVIGTEIS